MATSRVVIISSARAAYSVARTVEDALEESGFVCRHVRDLPVEATELALADFRRALDGATAVVLVLTARQDDLLQESPLYFYGPEREPDYLLAGLAAGYLGVDRLVAIAGQDVDDDALEILPGHVKRFAFDEGSRRSLGSAAKVLTDYVATLRPTTALYVGRLEGLRRFFAPSSPITVELVLTSVLIVTGIFVASSPLAQGTKIAVAALLAAIEVSFISARLLVRGQRESNDRIANLRDTVRFELDEQRQVLSVTNSRLRTFVAAPALAERQPSASLSTNEPNSAMLAELHHALATPLAHIDATTSVLESASNGEPSVNEHEALDRIRSSVSLCWAFLEGFRNIATTLPDTRLSAPLDTALHAAMDVYAATYGTAPKLEIDVGTRVPGYANSYVLACILPILENAVEASAPNASIVVRQSLATSGASTIEVTSQPTSLPPAGDEIYRSGFTLKNSAKHRGLGLAGVVRLISAHDGATVHHLLMPPKVTFTVTLPTRRDEPTS
jgi:signal transduction histidine kinase